MVAALGAGAGVTDALENAMRESRRPLRPQLEDVVGRIRFGDDPRTVYHGLTQRVPLETFLLFSSALSVQSETGGSLAPTLASVGRTIRDRIEIARRIRSNSAQSEVSTLAVMMLTYFIALVVWRTNPEQMSQFLATSVGQWAVAGTILLQAVGLVWMSLHQPAAILRQVDENTRGNEPLAGAGRPDLPGLSSAAPPGHESAESGKTVHGTGRIWRSNPTAIPWSQDSSAVGSSWRAIASPVRPPRSSPQCSWQSAWGLPRCSPFEAPA